MSSIVKLSGNSRVTVKLINPIRSIVRLISRILKKCRLDGLPSPVVYPLKDKSGNEYTTITIGGLEIIVENLRTTKYADGSDIPNITNATPDNKITTWVASNDPYDVFTFSGADISRAYKGTNVYAKRDTNSFNANTGDKLIIDLDLTLTAGAIPNFSLVVYNGLIFDEVISLTVNEGVNSIEYDVLADRTFYLSVSNGSLITDFSLITSIIIQDELSWVSDTEGAYCAYDNDIDNIPVYGLLYNWYAIDRLAYLERNGVEEVGWRVFTYDDITSLNTIIGNNKGALKLQEPGLNHWDSDSIYATNEYGFTARGSGERTWDDGVFVYLKYQFLMWINYIESESRGRAAYMRRDLTADIVTAALQKNYGFSVRLVRDV